MNQPLMHDLPISPSRTMERSDLPLNQTLDCVHLRVTLQLSHGSLGAHSGGLIRAAIKDALLANQGMQAMALLEPMKHAARLEQQTKGKLAKTNVDCSGLIVVCPRPTPAQRLAAPSEFIVDLKFLGQASAWAGVVLMGLQTSLAHGWGARDGVQASSGATGLDSAASVPVRGVIHWVSAWGIDATLEGHAQGARTLTGQWHTVELAQLLLMPNALASFAAPGHWLAMSQAAFSWPALEGALPHRARTGRLLLRTTSPWLRLEGDSFIYSAPALSDVMVLTCQRLERALLAWGHAPEPLANRDLKHLVTEPLTLSDWPAITRAQCTQANWARQRPRSGTRFDSMLKEKSKAKSMIYQGCEGELVFACRASQGLIETLFWGVFLHVGQQTSVGKGGFHLEWFTTST
jgi:hypothetical protein